MELLTILSLPRALQAALYAGDQADATPQSCPYHPQQHQSRREQVPGTTAPVTFLSYVESHNGPFNLLINWLCCEKAVHLSRIHSPPPQAPVYGAGEVGLT